MSATLLHKLGRWRGPITAGTLAVVIALMTNEVMPIFKTELRLNRANNELANNNATAAIEIVGKAAASRRSMSRRQRQRALQIANEAVATLRGERSLLRKVGNWSFDPASPAHQYPTAAREMTLIFELPPALRALSPKIRVSSAGEELCEVRLAPNGTSANGGVTMRPEGVLADVDLICAIGILGPVTSPIAHNLRLVYRPTGPVLRLHAGGLVRDLTDGQPAAALQVVRGTPLIVEMSDDFALKELQWSVDGFAHDPYDFIEDESPTKRIQLPDTVTAQAANRRLLELKASNSTATTHGVVDLLVRDPAAAPISSAKLETRELKDGSHLHVGEKALRLVVTMADGELADDLSITWGGKRLNVRANGQEVTGSVATEAEGDRPVLLEVKGAPEIRGTIHFDWTPPKVRALLDPGRFERQLEVRRAVDEAPIGAILEVTVIDEKGLDPAHVMFTPEGLEEIADDPASRPAGRDLTITRRYRCAKAGDASITVSGADLAGNQTTTHVYRIKIADPMEGRTVTVNGQPFPANGVAYSSATRFEVRTEGGIDVDGLGFYVFDPERKNDCIGEASLERTDQPKTRACIVDIGPVTTSGRRFVGALSRNGQQLLKGTVVVDFVPPVFRVNGLDSGGMGRKGIARFFTEPGRMVSLTVTDDVGVDVKTISVLTGATIEKVQTEGDETAVVIIMPAVLEGPVVLKAADQAGNEVKFEFEPVLQPEPESRPGTPASRPVTPPPTPDSGPPPPERPPKLGELQGTQKIVHLLLGTFLLVPMPDDAGVAPFYMGETEVTVQLWRAFVSSLQSRVPTDPQGARVVGTEAGRILNKNTNTLKKGDDEPLAFVSPDLAKAYVKWANDVARDRGVWKLPTAVQWRLAAGRATHPNAEYPTTGAFLNGSDLTNEGNGGALFGRDPIKSADGPKRTFQAGAFGLKGMPGSLYEWVVDPSGQLRLSGGSLVSSKDACRLDAPPRSAHEVADWERGLRLVLLPHGK